MISNLDTYLEIARDACRVSKDIASAQTRPRPGGEPGFIISYDPQRTSFKHSVIAVVFAGIYFEALLHIEGNRRLGTSRWRRIERQKDKRYEVKLKALGITDDKILAACTQFREARNDIVHEKALQLIPSTKAKLRIAQREAENALSFVDRIARLLRAA